MSVQELEAIVIGGSSGAIEALLTILPALPPTFATPLAIVLHLLPSKPSGLVEVLRAVSTLSVKEVDDKEPLVSGTVYVGPPNYHLLIEKQHCFALSVDEPVYFSRPSIDVLFESAADAYGPKLAGVLLSGANEDGARGLERIHAAGGVAIVQAPSSATARYMPEAALRLVPDGRAVPLAEIGPLLARIGGVSRSRAS